MKFSPYAYSKVNTYMHCPKKFKYVYIDKVKTKNIVDMTALNKGRAVHDILEKYPEQSNAYLADKYRPLTLKFINSELGQKYLSVNSIREMSFGITKDLKQTTYKDKQALYRGKIDHVCKIDNMLHLIDWKTGKYKEEKWQDYTQLLTYALYFFIRYPKINNICISFVYVEHNSENKMVLDRNYLFNYFKTLIEPIKLIESDQTWAKSPGRLCEWCDFRERCNKDL